MKRLLLFIVVMFLFIPSVHPQTGSNYYLPLQVGNFTKLRCENQGNGWSSRTILITYEGMDMINGIPHYREHGIEYDGNNWGPFTFRMIWLRKDDAGNVIMGAISTNDSGNPDSAMIINSPYFPNEYLTAGYARHYSYEKLSYRDSILSVSETVTVPAGTFYNCIKFMTSHYDSNGVEIFRETQCYAPNVGYIYNMRDIPGDEYHVDQLVEYNIVSDVNDPNITPVQYSLNQNYPNPFNPATKISFSMPERNFVTLKIYDAMGREAAVLLSKELNAGTHSVDWNAANLSSGVYFYRLESGNFRDTKKLLLLK